MAFDGGKDKEKCRRMTSDSKPLRLQELTAINSLSKAV